MVFGKVKYSPKNTSNDFENAVLEEFGIRIEKNEKLPSWVQNLGYIIWCFRKKYFFHNPSKMEVQDAPYAV
jgi:hypothetical protein